jgi:O-antigen ligase
MDPASTACSGGIRRGWRGRDVPCPSTLLADHSGRKEFFAEPAGGAIGTLVIYALKLLLPILVICILALIGLRSAFAPLLTKTQYQRAWAVMIGATIVAFLGHSLLLYIVAIGVFALFAQAYLGGGVRGKIATFLLLMLILPPLAFDVGGVGGINYLLELTGPRVLVLALLVGPALKFLGDRTFKRPRWVAGVDLAVITYQLLKIVLMVPHSTVTTSLRSVVESLLDVLLPYYVVSRGIRSEADLRFMLSHLALGCVLAASVGFAEFFVHRNLYSELQWVYGYKWQLTMTLMRGDHVRVQAMTPQPIVLAFEMIFALGLWTYLRGSAWRLKSTLCVYALMAACLVFTFSRGPWIGAVVFGISLLGLSKLPIKTFVALFLLFVIGGIVVKAAGADAIVMTALGGLFGSEAADISSIAYRNELLDSALALLKQSPWLGVPDYGAQMQELKQGEGIIDLVNSYIAIALDTGVIGLVIYARSLWTDAGSPLPRARRGRPAKPSPGAPVHSLACSCR